ncbi:MAG: tRNA (adenosine(37)-N6)-threonylcarbamoyltransferase complex dimerization subunit type 1 TsaB [Bryobacteraceae bacterium]|nr:tRNA (adenosine(37)-N6)-threonylcarbamoyltransferase complex dimerization subunit type 1 TsaB [Bryobacteraceae bacterium]
MNARILSLDTTSEYGSLALAAGDQVLEELPLHAPDGFGQILYGCLARLLARHGWDLRDMDCFAAASGPGSFTGVRIGLAAVKGLAEVIGRPAVAVSNLAAAASFGSLPLRAVVLDARRGEVYGAVYNAALEPVQPEVATSFTAWLGSLPPEEIEFISTGFAPFQPALRGTRYEDALVTEAPRVLAGAMARIAAAGLRAGRVQEAAAIEANYVRHSDAERYWRAPDG